MPLLHLSTAFFQSNGTLVFSVLHALHRVSLGNGSPLPLPKISSSINLPLSRREHLWLPFSHFHHHPPFWMLCLNVSVPSSRIASLLKCRTNMVIRLSKSTPLPSLFNNNGPLQRWTIDFGLAVLGGSCLSSSTTVHVLNRCIERGVRVKSSG